MNQEQATARASAAAYRKAHGAAQASDHAREGAANLAGAADVCVSIPGCGGIIGLFISDRASIAGMLKQYNDLGYRLTGFTRESRTNLLYAILQFVCLICTLGFWSPASGGLLFFTRNR